MIYNQLLAGSHISWEFPSTGRHQRVRWGPSIEQNQREVFLFLKTCKMHYIDCLKCLGYLFRICLLPNPPVSLSPHLSLFRCPIFSLAPFSYSPHALFTLKEPLYSSWSRVMRGRPCSEGERLSEERRRRLDGRSEALAEPSPPSSTGSGTLGSFNIPQTESVRV